MIKSKGSVTKRSTNVAWFKNVARSLGYTSTDLITQMTPSIGEFFSVNAEFTKEVTKDLRDLKSQSSQLGRNFSATSSLQIGRTALKNAMSDIKSGKIYNKDRIMKDAGGGFGDDFDFDDFNFDSDTTDGSSPVRPIIINQTQNQAPALAAMQQNSEAIYRTAQVANETAVTLATNKMIMDQKANTRIVQGLQSINDNMAMLVNFHSDSMTKYIGASIKYYEENLGMMNKTLAELQKTTAMYAQQQEAKPANDPASEVFGINGGLDGKAYLNMVKRNFKNVIDGNPMLAQLSWMANDKSTLQGLASSPLSFISTTIVSTLLPQYLKRSFDNLDKSFSNFFPAIFSKFARMTSSTNNPFLRMFGEIFGVQVREKEHVDLSRYHKGPMPFDGKAHKAITEVIPGYLRKILAAVSGEEDMAYDYEKGKFAKVTDMEKEFTRQKNSKVLNSYDSIDKIKEISEAFVFQNKEDRKAFNEGIDKFFLSLTKQPGLVNPRLRTGKYGETIDDLQGVHDFGNPGMLRMFRQVILSLPKSEQTKIFGRDFQDAKRNNQQFMTGVEKNPDMYNAATLFNGLGYNSNVTFDKQGKAIAKKGGGFPGLVDKFNLTAVDYLRDIKRTLLQGIRVYGSTGGGGRRGSGGVLSAHDSALEEMDRQNKNAKEQPPTYGYSSELSDDQFKNIRGQGRMPVQDAWDLEGMSDHDISRVISGYNEEKNRRVNPGQKGGMGQWFGSILRGDKQERYNDMREKVNSLLNKPAEMIDGVVRRIDNTMYKLIFGSSDDDDDPSLMSKTMAMMRDQFTKMGKWFNEKIVDPLHESLFGKEGIVTKLKNSDFYKNMTGRMKKIGESIFGKPDGDGKHNGGLLSDTANSMRDMWDGMKYYFNGKAYTNRAGVVFKDNTEQSIFGETRSIFRGFKENINTYLMGSKKDDKSDYKEKGVLGGALNSIKEGFHNFGMAIFGPNGFKNKDASQTFGEMTQKIKAGAPKAFSWGIVGGGAGLFSGSFGLLGSLFLPGGPIGGAIVGTTLGFLSQSDRFKDTVFGKKDADGKRLGGMISQSTQEFFRKHKVAIVGGAGFGMLKGMASGIGLLPSFFLPGGIVGGALMGVGTSLLVRSEGFQKMLFGPEDKDGKRTGGIIAKAFGENKKFKNLMGNTAVGALGGAGFGLVASKLGIMGAMLVPGGPIGGAILGAATGIALSSDRWKKALFGEWDEKTGLRNGGMLGKFQNWFKLEVQEPLKLQLKDINLNIKEWFQTSIANPFTDAIAPMKLAFTNMTKNLETFFVKGWDSFKTKIGDVFEKNVGLPFGRFMEEKVMKPLKGFLSKIVNGVGKVFGTLFASPFKVLSSITAGVQQKQEKRGLQRFIDDGWDDMGDYRGRRERGERMGLFKTRDKEGNVVGKGVFGRINDMYFNKETRQEAREGEHGASYAASERVRIAERDKLQKEEMAVAREKLAQEKKRLAMHRKLGLKYDYENFDENGQNISRIYSIYQKMSKEGVVDGTGRQLVDKLGISPETILGPDADMNNLTKAQKKKLSNAVKRGLRGRNVAQLFEEPKSEEASSEEVVNSVETMSSGVTKEIQSSNKHLTKIEHLLEKIAGGMGVHSVPVGKGAILPSKITGNIGKRFSNAIMGGRLSVKGIKGGIEPASHASGIDNVPHDDYAAFLHQGEMVIPAQEANYIRKIFGMPSQKASSATGPIGGANAVVNGISAKGKGGMSIFQSMNMYLRTIAVSVHGQLDGVGKNVFKIRKIIQNGYGIADADITGNANKDRVGFMGKLKNVFFKPFDAIRQQVTKVMQAVTDKITAFATGVKNATKAILMVPVNIAKGIWDFTKQLGNIAKETAISIAKIPLQVTKMATAALQGAVEVIKMVGPAVADSLLGVAKFFSGALAGAGHAITGFGKGVGAFFNELGKGAAQLVSQFGIMTTKLIGSASKLITESFTMVTKFTMDTTHMILDGTLRMLNTVGKKMLDIGDTMLQMVTSPLKYLAGTVGKLVGKKEQEVIVKGGHLDTLGSIERVEKVVVIEKEVHTHIVPEGLKRAFGSVTPIPVRIEGQGGAPAPSNKGGFDLGVLAAAGASVPGGKTGGILNVLEKFTQKKEKQEESRLRQAAIDEKIANRKAQVTRKTATYQLDALKAKDKEEFQVNATNRQISLLEKIAGATTEQKDNWLDIFGKAKGILTMATLAALPFLKDIFGAIRNLIFPSLGDGTGGGFTWGERQGEARADSDGTHIADAEQREDIIKAAGKGYTKYGAPLVKKAVQMAKPVVKTVATLAEPVVKPVGKLIAKGTVKAGDAILKTVGKSNTVKSAVIAGTIKSNVVKDQMKTSANKIRKSILSIFEKFFSTKWVVDKLGPNAMVVMKDVMGKVGAAFTTQNITKHMGRLSNAFLKTGGKGAASAATLGITDAAFAAWDLSTGAFEAAHMFMVNEEAVDAKMRISASVTKAMFGYFPIVSVVADIFSEITGVNLKEYVASSIYSILASSEDVAELEENQNAFEQEWAEFKDATGTNMTLDAYNDKVNQTVGGKVVRGAKKAWKGTKNFFGSIGSGIATGTKAVGRGIATGAKAAWNGTKWLGGKIGEGASWAGDKAVQIGTGVWNKTGGRVVKSFSDDEQIKKNFNVTGDGRITTGMKVSSTAGTLANMATMGLWDTDDATRKMYDLGLKARGYWEDTSKFFDDKVAKPVSDTWNIVSGTISDSTAKMKEKASEKWTTIKDTAGKAWDKISGFIGKKTDQMRTTASTSWEGMKDTAGKAWDKISGFISKKTDTMRTAASTTWDGMKDTAGKAWDVISGFVSTNTESIKTSTDEKWGGIKLAVSDTWEELKTGISGKLDPMVEEAKKKWGEIQENASTAWKDMSKELDTKWKTIKTNVSGFFSKVGSWFSGSSDEVDRELENLGFTVGGGNGGSNRGRVAGPSGGGFGSPAKEEGGGFGEPTQLNGFSYYSQNDPEWASYSYDHSPQVGSRSKNPTLSYRGCGPTAMAMVASGLTGKDYKPTQLADLARAGGYSTSAGTTWAYFPAMAKKFGLKSNVYNPKSSRATLIANLQKGIPTIISGTRTRYKASESPFTTGGHFVVATGIKGNQMMVNDPRGPAYSKAYNIDRVINESKQAWSFTRGDGSVPLPDVKDPGSNISTTLNGAKAPKEYTVIDLFGKMGENLQVLVDNIYGGTNKKLSWDDAFEQAAAEEGIDTSAPGFSLDFVPSTIQDKILKKTIELTISSESGGNYYYGRNDTSSKTGKKISPSIGVMQWRGNNAKSIMQQMYKQLPNSTEAKYFANLDWNNSAPWSKAQQDRLENYLRSNGTVTKKVQDSMVVSHVKNTNLGPVYKYGVNTGKIKDPRSIVMLGEFANTGPAHVRSFMNSYSRTNGAEFPHFLKEFKSKSYWGKREIYNSRIKKVSSALQEWDPEQGGYGEGSPDLVFPQEGGGFGGDNLDLEVPSVKRASTVDFSSGLAVPTEYQDSYISATQRQTPTVINNNTDSALLNQAIQVLKEIAGHTGNTSQGISRIKERPINLTVEGGQAKQSGNNIVVVSNGGNGGGSNIVNNISSGTDRKNEAKYAQAKKIASGRR